jgi:fructokinase
LLSYDPNVRPRLLGTPERGRELVERSVRLAHVVKASDEDIAWLYPDLEITSVARAWLELGAQVVVVTAGPDGATAYLPTGAAIQRAGRAVSVVDTVGAGDAFTAGLLDALARRSIDAPEKLAQLADRSTLDTVLADVLDDAILVAALTCERAGADPPTRAQLDARRVS